MIKKAKPQVNVSLIYKNLDKSRYRVKRQERIYAKVIITRQKYSKAIS